MEHKLILGGEQYLPFARSRIKALRATGLQYASQQFEVDGVSVKVRIAGEHEYIRLEAGGSSGYRVLPANTAFPAGTGTPQTARVSVGKAQLKVVENSTFDAYYTSWVGASGDILLYETGVAGRYMSTPTSRTGGIPFGAGGPFYAYLNETRITLTGTPHGMGRATFGDDSFLIVANNQSDTQTRFYASKNGAAFTLVGEATCAATHALNSTWIFSPDGRKAVTKRRKLKEAHHGSFSEYPMPFAAPVEVTFSVDGLGVLSCSTTVGAVVGLYSITPAPPGASEVADLVAYNEVQDIWRYTFSQSGVAGIGIEVHQIIGFEYVGGIPEPVVIEVREQGVADYYEQYYGDPVSTGRPGTPPYTALFVPQHIQRNNSYRTRTITLRVGANVFFTKSTEIRRVATDMSGPQNPGNSGTTRQWDKTMIPGFTHIDGRDRSCSGVMLLTAYDSAATRTNGVDGTPVFSGFSNTATTFLKTAYEDTEVLAGQASNDNGNFSWVAPVSGFTSGPTATYSDSAFSNNVPYVDVAMRMITPCYASRKPGEYVFSQRVDSRQTSNTGYSGSGMPNLSPNFYSAASPASGRYTNIQSQFTLGAGAGFGLGQPRIIPTKKKRA